MAAKLTKTATPGIFKRGSRYVFSYRLDGSRSGRAMSEESTTPHPAEQVRQTVEAGNRGELDSAISYFAHDAFWDASRTAGERFEGAAAVRGSWEDWLRAYEDVEFAFDELLDVGNGVVLAVVSQEARPAGATGFIRQQEGWVWESVDGLFAGVTVYHEAEIDEARAAAERLAEVPG